MLGCFPGSSRWLLDFFLLSHKCSSTHAIYQYLVYGLIRHGISLGLNRSSWFSRRRYSGVFKISLLCRTYSRYVFRLFAEETAKWVISVIISVPCILSPNVIIVTWSSIGH